MELPTLNQVDVKGKSILLRLDLDVPFKGEGVADDTRLLAAVPTITHLLGQGSGQIIILGHRGRPAGKTVESLSLKPVGEHLEGLLVKELGKERIKKANIFMMENLRFNTGEEAADEHFAEHLAEQSQVYINDAFAASHAEHASIVGLPKLLPHFAGLHLASEVRVLGGILEKPRKPVVFVVGGAKMDKVRIIPRLLDHAEWVLVGGLLPKKVKSYCREKDDHWCIAAAHLTGDGEDITPDSARNFAEIIKSAGTLVWNGPMGDVDNGHWEGTEIIAHAVVESNAYKVVGGGDTIHALQQLKLANHMDYISTGGGSMLEFLAYGDLPGLRALRQRQR